MRISCLVLLAALSAVPSQAQTRRCDPGAEFPVVDVGWYRSGPLRQAERWRAALFSPRWRPDVEFTATAAMEIPTEAIAACIPGKSLKVRIRYPAPLNAVYWGESIGCFPRGIGAVSRPSGARVGHFGSIRDLPGASGDLLRRVQYVHAGLVYSWYPADDLFFLGEHGARIENAEVQLTQEPVALLFHDLSGQFVMTDFDERMKNANEVVNDSARITFRDGSTYVGRMQGRAPQGRGVLTSREGARIEGEVLERGGWDAAYPDPRHYMRWIGPVKISTVRHTTLGPAGAYEVMSKGEKALAILPR